MKGTTSFRKKSAIVLFGVMTLGLSAHMMASAVSEIGDAGNKTLQIVKDSDAKSNSHLFLDLKNKNESSFLYTDNTNKNTDSHANKTNDDFFYIDGMPKNKVKSGLRKNTKAALGVLSSSAIAAGTGYAVKKFVANKWTSEEVNQSLVGKEKQSNDYKGTSEKVNQSLGGKKEQNSDYKGTSEKVDQSVGEKEKQNSDHKDTSEKVNQILGKKEKQNSDNKGSSEKVKQSLGKQEKKYNNEKKENKGKNDQGSVTSDTIDENKNGANTQEPISKSSELNSEKVLSSKIISLEGLSGLIIFGVLVTLAIRFKNSESSKEGLYSSKKNSEKEVIDKNLILDEKDPEKEINQIVDDGIGTAEDFMEIYGFEEIDANNVVAELKRNDLRGVIVAAWNGFCRNFNNIKVSEGIDKVKLLNDLKGKMGNFKDELSRVHGIDDEKFEKFYKLCSSINDYLNSIDNQFRYASGSHFQN